jgi:hypothetical protein
LPGKAASKLITDKIASWGTGEATLKAASARESASLKDPAKLFNSSLDGNVRPAIDIHEGEEIKAKAFKALIRAAVALNASGGKKASKRR